MDVIERFTSRRRRYVCLISLVRRRISYVVIVNLNRVEQSKSTEFIHLKKKKIENRLRFHKHECETNIENVWKALNQWIFSLTLLLHCWIDKKNLIFCAPWHLANFCIA